MILLPDRPAFRSALCLLGASLIACTPVQSAEPRTATFQCNGGRLLHVMENGNRATVQVEQRRYDLKAKRSSLGDRYVSDSASLIIDGSFAAFVAEDLLDLENCRSDI